MVCELDQDISRLGIMLAFPKIRDTVFWGPYNKDPTILGTIGFRV